MAKQPQHHHHYHHSSAGVVASPKRWLLAFLVTLSASTLIAFLIRAAFDTCDRSLDDAVAGARPAAGGLAVGPSPLGFMRSKPVLLVSHELSLSGNLDSLLCYCCSFYCWLEKVVIFVCLGGKVVIFVSFCSC